MDEPLTEKSVEPLVFEETPVIEPIPPFPQPTPAPQAPVQPPLPMPQKPHTSWGNRIGYLILFLLLFALGMWLSTMVRQYLPGSGPAPSLPVPTPAARQVIPTDPYADWITYQIISGITRQPIAAVSFKLPPEILAPICDGAGCPSQGTYLPGGTRFTVAARGAGQTLRDYRGAVVTDVLGQPFATRDAGTTGKMGVTFSGAFNGTTVGGYAFSRMAGEMIPVSDTLSVEFNHFTPSGITADFESDEVLFEKILKSINLATGPR
ncbi:MAG: hypothetical protein AAB457_03755 [Patescibacteria group bacterium]